MWGTPETLLSLSYPKMDMKICEKRRMWCDQLGGVWSIYVNWTSVHLITKEWFKYILRMVL